MLASRMDLPSEVTTRTLSSTFNVTLYFIGRINLSLCTRYQKDIDQFGNLSHSLDAHRFIHTHSRLFAVNVIKGALQLISVPSQDSFLPTLGGQGWRPPPPGSDKQLIFQGNNPDQKPELNLKASAVTRTVGGMATHWTCACRK